ncbi:NADPH-dependent FMN reductase [Rhodococcus sp. 114MFTsu3.1]|uniref:NADPH-dependent FMN reductase n=1 Tax=Rhodococcus sp. 114MFTsu3.1 TaxID=1172184 RepID=UPI0005643802|nr:NAD(P)H-dependent oxidoreductase [Rhodococcus sp. 114MFTsu3.1]
MNAVAPNIVGVIASSNTLSRTSTAVRGVLDGAVASGATVQMVELATTTVADAIDAIDGADGVVLGCAVYRARHTATLASLLESVERCQYGETRAPLMSTAAAIVMGGASENHSLASQSLERALNSFFAVRLVSPPLYPAQSDYIDATTLTEHAATLAQRAGGPLAELAAAVRSSRHLARLEPQI